jgi:perosamine synthetase
VLRSGRLVQGPMVERFEDRIRRIVGTRHAVAMNNGTSALIAAMLAHDVGPGDEVITSPFTFVATLNAVLLVGATPRFVDIGEDCNLDPGLLEEAIGPATKAVLPVHLYGYPADLESVVAVTNDTSITVIEDAAQALGARQGDKAVGSFGTGCFSFYATKNVTTAEGGVVTTDDDGVADRLRVLRNQGQRERYDYERPGYNFRMTELQAAIGVAQLSRLDHIIEARRSNAHSLRQALEGIPGLVLPTDDPHRRHVFHQFTIRLMPDASISRDRFISGMAAKGIECGVYYPRRVFDYPCFRRDPRIGEPHTPVAERICREVVSLPVHPALAEPDVAAVAEAVREVLA